jgi:hypothetical protein
MSGNPDEPTGNGLTAGGEPETAPARRQATDPLQRALLDAAPQPPVDAVDWVALQARIASRAEPALERLAAAENDRIPAHDHGGRVAGPDAELRGMRPAAAGADLLAGRIADATRAAAVRGGRGVTAGLWQPLAGWSPLGIPLAAAATVVLMLGAALVGTQPVDAGADVAFRTIEEEFMSGLGDGAAPLYASAGGEDLLDAVLFHDREEW